MARPVLAGGLALLLLLLQGFAVSPSLHHWLHEDADAAHHDCAAVLLQKGLLEGAPVVAAAPPPPAFTLLFAASPAPAPSVRLRMRPPERAPPLG